MNTNKQFGEFCSAAVYGSRDESNLHAHVVPVFATSTFVFDSAEQGMNRFAGNEPGYIYSRFGNPTVNAAEELLASLEAFALSDENGSPLKLKAFLQSSGQGALATLCFSLLKSGDTVLAHTSLYGGTMELFKDLMPDLGINLVFVDLTNLKETEKIISQHKNAGLLHMETPTNPTLDCVDIDAVCRLAKPFGIKVSIDNTFATPYLQQPFSFGVDFVYHSTTKFLNGHGTAVGGVLVGKDLGFMNSRVKKIHKLLGANASPFDAFLLINGIKTLTVRMDKHCDNAEAVARFLNGHIAVEKVCYNGLPDHAGYEITQKQMRRAGAVLSFELKGGLEAGKSFINKLQTCTRAVSLGTIDTLISHPASMSHSGMKREDRIAGGITDGLIRMSVGIEGIADIIEDLEQALGN